MLSFLFILNFKANEAFNSMIKKKEKNVTRAGGDRGGVLFRKVLKQCHVLFDWPLSFFDKLTSTIKDDNGILIKDVGWFERKSC